MTRADRALMVTIALALGLALGAWLLLPQLFERIARHRLEAAGFENVELTVKSLSWRQLTLEGMAVTARGDNAWRLRARGIESVFRLRQVWRGKLDSVSVRRVELYLPSGGEAGPIDAGAILGWLRQPWVALVPLDHLVIESLAVEIEAAAEPIRIESRIEADRSDTAIDVRIGLHGSGGAVSAARLRWAQAGAFELRLMPVDGRTAEPLGLAVSVPDSARGRRGTLHVSGEDLTRWLVPLVATSMDVRGSMSADFAVTPEAQSGLALEAQATFKDVSAQGAQFESARLQMNAAVDRAAGGLVVQARPGTAVELASLRFGELHLANTRVEWTGTLSTGPAGIALETRPGTWIRVESITGGAFAVNEVEATVVGRHLQAERGFTTNLSDPLVLRAARLRIGAARMLEPEFKVAGAITRTDRETRVALEPGTRAQVAGVRWGEIESDAIAVNLSGSYSHDGDIATATVDNGTRIRFERLRSRDWRIGEATAALAGRLEHTVAQTRFVVEPASELTVSQFHSGGLEFDEAHFVPTGSRALHARTDNATSLDAGAWRLRLSPIRFAEHRFAPGPVELELAWRRGADSQLTARLATARADLQTYGYRVGLTDLEADVGVSPGGLSAQLRFARHGARFDADVRYRSEDGSGRINFASEPFDLAVAQTALSRFVEPWPYDFDLVAGAINTRGTAWWKTRGAGAPGVQVDVRLDDTGGFYGPVAFSGLSTELALDVVPELQTRGSAPIKLGSVDFGIVMTDLDADLTLSPSLHGDAPRYTLHNVGANFLGGRIHSDTIEFDPNRVRNTLNLGIRNVDLHEIVTLHDFDGLDATGRVNGTLPVTIDAGGVSVDGGEIRGVPPGGYIRYRPNSGGNELNNAASGTGIVMEVLREFNYDVLNADLNYAADGAMQAAVHLEGTSSAFEGGRPVHLNVNLEQNLLALLKSLRLIGGLNDTLDKRVREYYEARP